MVSPLFRRSLRDAISSRIWEELAGLLAGPTFDVDQTFAWRRERAMDAMRRDTWLFALSLTWLAFLVIAIAYLLVVMR
jgi:hypothetical protein